jgi:hypothetical protein
MSDPALAEAIISYTVAKKPVNDREDCDDASEWHSRTACEAALGNKITEDKSAC